LIVNRYQFSRSSDGSLKIQYARDAKGPGVQHAPTGGVTVQGTDYVGGQFIPGDVMAKATDTEKDAVEGKPDEKSGESSDGSIKPDGRAERDAKIADWKANGFKSKVFKNWFGDWENDPASASKVVDAKGEPQENHEIKSVFHGRREKFSEFSKGHVGKNGSAAGAGFYFAENRKIAETYAYYGGKPDDTGDILSAYLSIKNPFDFHKVYDGPTYDNMIESVYKLAPETFDAESGQSREVKDLTDISIINSRPLTGHRIWTMLKMAFEAEKATSILAEMGFDGITHKSKDMNGTPSTSENDKDYGRVWVAFEPNQIKSTENKGTFDPDTAHIRYSRESSLMTYSFSRSSDGSLRIRYARTNDTDPSDASVMIALKIPPTIGGRIAIDGGETVDELHCTLAYLGRMGEVGTAGVKSAADVIKQVIDGYSVKLVGEITGYGRFSASESSDGKDVIYAGLDIPGLTYFRELIASGLLSAAVPFKTNHGFTPHVTLKYIGIDDESPIRRLPPIPITFDSIYLVVGESWSAFPLSENKTAVQYARSASTTDANGQKHAPSGDSDGGQFVSDKATADHHAATSKIHEAAVNNSTTHAHINRHYDNLRQSVNTEQANEIHRLMTGKPGKNKKSSIDTLHKSTTDLLALTQKFNLAPEQPAGPLPPMVNPDRPPAEPKKKESVKSYIDKLHEIRSANQSKMAAKNDAAAQSAKSVDVRSHKQSVDAIQEAAGSGKTNYREIASFYEGLRKSIDTEQANELYRLKTGIPGKGKKSSIDQLESLAVGLLKSHQRTQF
jgi:2'-5' RNA ligase